MFKHVVMYTLKPEFKKCGKEAVDMFLSMKENINVIKKVSSGINTVTTNRSYDFILELTFNSIDDFYIYKNHPYHINTVQPLIHKLKDKSHSVDYFIEEED